MRAKKSPKVILVLCFVLHQVAVPGYLRSVPRGGAHDGYEAGGGHVLEIQMKRRQRVLQMVVSF